MSRSEDEWLYRAADRVEPVLPEAGVCGGSGTFDDAERSGGCCAPAPEPIRIGGLGSSRA
jgi:hypothetical protein